MFIEAAVAKKKRTGGNYGDYLPFKGVRIPEELHRRVAEIARANFRPVSWQIRQFLQDGCEEYYRKQGRPAPAPDEPAP